MSAILPPPGVAGIAPQRAIGDFTGVPRVAYFRWRSPSPARCAPTLPPLYAAGGESWAVLMRGAIVHDAALFNSHRMLRRYAAEVYLGSA